MVLYMVLAFQVWPVTIFISEESTEGECDFGAHLLGYSIVFWVPVVLVLL
jgi:hypothetical protein